MRIVSITCYFDPNYIRTQVLESLLNGLDDVDVVPLHNTRRGLLRYPEVLIRLLKFRLTQPAPDYYLLNFRGYELLPFVLFVAGRTPIIFDEFINPVEVLQEHRKQKNNPLIKALMACFVPFAHLYYWLLRHCRLVLIDTEAHKRYTAGQSGLPLELYASLPVGTDEQLFKPKREASSARPPFQVFYYGSMVPLHGVQYLIDAAVLLKDIPDITFVIAGKTGHYKAAIDAAVKEGAHITCLEWINFVDLPHYIQQSRVCIGGPLGGTLQANYVVTGKTYQFLASEAVALVGKNEATTMFIDKQNALVVPQADAEAIAASLRWAYQHTDNLAGIAQAGLRLYKTQFSQTVLRSKLSTLLKEIS